MSNFAMTQEAFEEYLRQIGVVESQITKLNESLSKSTSEKREIEDEIKYFTVKLEELKEKLPNIAVLDPLEASLLIATVGRNTIVKLHYHELNETTVYTFRLIDGARHNENELSLVSGVGSKIHKKSIGYTECYSLNGENFTLDILGIEKNE